jgi:hypothetical protein
MVRFTGRPAPYDSITLCRVPGEWEAVMSCKSCGSANQKKFSAEIGIHFSELKDIDKAVVWVFSDVVVCLSCGTAEFAVPEEELHQLQQSDPTTLE